MLNPYQEKDNEIHRRLKNEFAHLIGCTDELRKTQENLDMISKINDKNKDTIK